MLVDQDVILRTVHEDVGFHWTQSMKINVLVFAPTPRILCFPALRRRRLRGPGGA